MVVLSGGGARRGRLAAAALSVVTAAVVSAAGAADLPAAAQGVGQLARADEVPVLRSIDVPAAWRITKGQGVTVGVLDTGADPSAPDLTGSVTTGPNFLVGVDPSGYRPPRLHGTYIASLIAGHGSGPGLSEGIIGVAPAASVLSIRVVLDKQEPGFLAYDQRAAYRDSIARGIRYAVRHGVGVINMSLGSILPSPDMRAAVGYAISRGVVVVASAGNDGAIRSKFSPYNYPAAFTGVISVAAVTVGGRRAGFSDHNVSVVVSAPGVNVPGAGPGGEYVIGSGTSPASALVAGIAALIRAKYPALSPALVVQAIVASARRRPPGGYNTDVGFGEVDAIAALATAARLAGLRPVTGLPPSAHFAAAPGPITVAHRDYRLAAVLLAIAILAVAGCAFAMTTVARRTARARDRRQAAGPDVGTPAPTAPDRQESEDLRDS